MKKTLYAAAMLPTFLWGCAMWNPWGETSSESSQAQAESPMASSPSIQASITPPASPGVEASPVASSSPSANGARKQLTRAQVRTVQLRLRAAGFDPGPTDGVMGPKTKAALKKYQGARGISGNGALDEKTLKSLGVE